MPMPRVRSLVLSAVSLLSAIVPLEAAAQSSPFFAPGNVVVVVEGCGVQGATCAGIANGTGTGAMNSSVGGYGDNQGAPMTLFQFQPTGVTSATYVNSLVLPQAAAGANLPFSGEYGSSSEGQVQLSGAGQYLTFMGYGINAATFDASPTTYGAAPSLALAQSGSLTGQSYTPIGRVIALVDPNGNVNTSSAIYNVFNLNNPRSVYTADGVNAYISGQGTGSGTDATGGVFYTPLGAVNNAPTAITGLDTTGNTLSQDTRVVQIYNGTLYVSVDTKGGSGSTRDYLGSLGTPPATSLYTGAGSPGPMELPLYNNAATPVAVSSNGKITLTASETTSLNSAGQQINLSPSGYFFANATTLYIADTGNSKQTSANNQNGDGGLQKWVLTNGQWQLQYTMAAGLGLVYGPNYNKTATTGSTGLYSVTGVVSADGKTVNLYVVNSTIADLDTTYVYGIQDTIAATSNANTFTKLATAPVDSNFKGISMAPTYPVGSATILTSPLGLNITVAGTGCTPGTYVTPVTLVWPQGTSCTLSTPTSQSVNGTTYGFTQWQDGTLNTSYKTVAPPTSATYTASFTSSYAPVGSLDTAVDTTTKSTNINVGDSITVTGWAADPVDGAPLSNVKVYVDNTVFGTPTLGIARTDVAAVYGASYLNSGYQLVMSTSTLALGAHTVTVVAVDSTGKTKTFGPLNVNLVATPTVTVSSGSIVYGTPTATLTADVAYSGSVAPTGGVTFTVGGSTSGVGPVTCTAAPSPLVCTATYMSSLAAGSYSIVATVAATNTYVAASGTGTLTVTSATDFSFAATGTTSQTTTHGSSVSYTFSLKPLFPSYPGTVSFSVAGLPAGATYTFMPTSVASTAGAQTVTLAVQTPQATSSYTPRAPWKTPSEVVLALCMLPVFFRRKLRKGMAGKLMMLFLVLGSVAGFAALTGCGNGTSVKQSIPVVYPLTVTATSGSVQHQATVTLTLQ